MSRTADDAGYVGAGRHKHFLCVRQEFRRSDSRPGKNPGLICPQNFLKDVLVTADRSLSKRQGSGVLPACIAVDQRRLSFGLLSDCRLLVRAAICFSKTVSRKSHCSFEVKTLGLALLSRRPSFCMSTHQKGQILPFMGGSMKESGCRESSRVLEDDDARSWWWHLR